MSFRFLLLKRGSNSYLSDLLCGLEIQKGTQCLACCGCLVSSEGKWGYKRGGAVAAAAIDAQRAGYVFKLGGYLDNLEAKTSLRKGIQ